MLKDAWQVAEELRVTGKVPDLTPQVKGLHANLLKGDKAEVWTNPFRDSIGNGSREKFQAPRDEPMEKKQRRFEALKAYDGESVQS